MRLRRVARLIVVVTLASGCRLTLNNDSTSSAGGATITQPTPIPSPTPSPTPAPTPTPLPGGTRTADPPAGQVLPLPLYGAAVVAQVTVDVAQSCTTFAFLDAVVDALRARDTRWGYACSSGGCASVSQDKVAYHATAGAEVTGATGVHVVDVIQNVCTAPTKQYLIVGYVAEGAWSSRGRF